MRKFLSLILMTILCLGAWAQDEGGTDQPVTPDPYEGEWYIQHVSTGIFLTNVNLGNWDTEVGLDAFSQGNKLTIKKIADSDKYLINTASKISENKCMGPDGSSRIFTDCNNVTGSGYTITPAADGSITFATEDGKALVIAPKSNNRQALWLKNLGEGETADAFKLLTIEQYNDLAIKSVEQFDNYPNGVFVIKSGNRGYFTYTANGLHREANSNYQDVNQQFLFLKNPEDNKRYLYSVGAHAFINITGKNENNNRAIKGSFHPEQDVQIEASTSSTLKATNPICLKIAGHHVGISTGFTPNVITHYNSTSDEGNALRIIATGLTNDITFEDATSDPKMALNETYNVAKTYTVGEGLNKYSLYLTWLGKEQVSNQQWNETIEQAEGILNETETATDEYIKTLTSTLEDYIGKLRHNMPQENTFLRMKSQKSGDKYVQSAAVGERLGVSTETGKESIFLYKNDGLVSYSAGTYIRDVAAGPRLTVGDQLDEASKTSIAFATATTNKNNYFVKFKNGTRTFYVNTNNTDAGSSPNSDTGYTIILEAVNELPIKMNLVDDAYYGTINFPVAVVIPQGMSAYSAKDNVNSLTLTKVAENGQVLAANTPVVIYSEENIEKLSISSDADVTVTDNDLQGTVEAIAVTSGNYVLSAADGIGFYKYTNTKMPAFKAYFAATSAQSQKFGFVFGDNDLTGVANAIKEAAKTGTTVFDINGRKVNELVKGQLYIQGGKKFRY